MRTYAQAYHEQKRVREGGEREEMAETKRERGRETNKLV